MGASVRNRVSCSARVGVRAREWPDAVRAACEPLVRNGCVTSGYAARCVELVRENGPYIVLAPGVALAHARPEDGARALGLSAVTLAFPVAFGHASNDPVDVVFAFASPDRSAHLGLLAALARHLVSGIRERLRAATSDELALRCIEEVVDDVDQESVRRADARAPGSG